MRRPREIIKVSPLRSKQDLRRPNELSYRKLSTTTTRKNGAVDAKLLGDLVGTRDRAVAPTKRRVRIIVVPDHGVVPGPSGNRVCAVNGVSNLGSSVQRRNLQRPLRIVPMGNRPSHCVLVDKRQH